MKKTVSVIAVIFLAVSILPLTVFIEEADANSSDLRRKVEDFNNEMTVYIQKAVQKQQSTYDLLGTITDDFTYSTTSPSSLSDDDVVDFMKGMEEQYTVYLDLMLHGYQLVEEWDELNNELFSSSPSSPGGYSTMAGEDTRAFFTTAALVVGLGMLAYNGYKAAKGAFNKNADMSKKIIDDASPNDLKTINDELGLPQGSSKEETKSYIDGLSLAQKNIAARKVQELDINAELDTSHGGEIKQNQANIANDLGKEGVKWYAGAVTTVTGGQGMDKLAKAAGLSSEGAAVVDMVLTVSEKQPLDQLGSHIETAITSKSKETTTVDAPNEHKTPSQAKSTLENAISEGTSKQEDVENAADSLGQRMAEDHADTLGTSEGMDGSKRVGIPEKVHVQDAGEVNNEESIDVPDIGESDVLVKSEDTAPDIISGVDLGEEDLELDMTPLDELERSSVPVDIVFCVDVTGSMSDDIAEVVSSATGMLMSVALRTDDYRMGFVCFRDIEVDSPAFERMPLSDDYNQIMANIGTLPSKVSGGGDWPESVYEGLYIANNMPFRDGAERTVILMGDAPGKTSYGGTRASPSYDEITSEEIEELKSKELDPEKIGEILRKNDVKVYSILISNDGYSYDETARTQFQSISNITGGGFHTAAEASEVPSMIGTALNDAIDRAGENEEESSLLGGLGVGCCCGSMVGLAVVLVVTVSLVAILKVSRKK
jgi:hypothetical protein